MSLFKNNIGRPSNETLKKRKILYLTVSVAIIVSLIGVLGFGYSYFNGKGIIGNSKNAASRMRVVKKSNVELRISRTLGGVYINDKLTLTSSIEVYSKSKKVYRQDVLYKNGKQVSKSACEVVNSNGVHRTYFVEENNSYYVKAFVYSDSKCKNQLAYVKSDTYKVGKITPKVTISHADRFQLTYKVQPQLSRNTYSKVVFYNDKKVVKTSACTKVKYNATINVKNPMARSGEQYYKVTLYSDNKCKKQVSSKTSKKFDTSIKPYLEFNDKKIENSIAQFDAYVSKKHKTVPVWNLKDVTKTFYYSAKKKTYNHNLVQIFNSSVATCKKITSGTNSQLALSVDNTIRKELIEWTVYSDSKCKKAVLNDVTTLHYDVVAPTISDVSIENGVGILEYASDIAYKNVKGMIKEAAIIPSLTSCNKANKEYRYFLGMPSFNKVKIPVDKKVDKQRNVKLCMWDYAGNLLERKITMRSVG